MNYSAFGLSIEADWPIPGLIAQAAPAPPDILIKLESRLPPALVSNAQPYYTADDDGSGMRALEVWKTTRHYRLRYADGNEFLIGHTGTDVRVVVARGSTLADAATYLLGPVLGFAMRLRGITCLHASIVAVGGEAIAIAGPAGVGKSTAAAAFASMGHAVLSDDIAALAEQNGTPHVCPAYPQIRLWPDSVAMLYGSPDALPPLTPTWEKRALSLARPGVFHEQPLPLSAVYLLGEERERSEPAFEDVAGSERLLLLLANTYVGYLLDRTMRLQEFESLARLSSAVRLRRVMRPRAATSAAEISERILEDCERFGCIALPTTAR